jgi:hypothetical protein
VNCEDRVLGIIDSPQHILQFESLDVRIELPEILFNLSGNLLVIPLFGKFDERRGIL